MFVCRFENCQKTYKKPSLLELHENTHVNTKPFACSHCEKKYFKNSHLKVHYLRIHAGTEKMSCERCGKILASEEGLKRHEEVCGRVFKCISCAMEFIRAKWYLEHLRRCLPNRMNLSRDGGTHNTVTNSMCKKKPKRKKEKDLYRCRICNRGYKLKRNCIYHEKVSHGTEEHECEICQRRYKHKGSLTRHKAIAHKEPAQHSI